MIATPSPIAVVAPSGAWNPERLQAGLQLAAAAGLRLDVLADPSEAHGYFAGSDDLRFERLLTALTDPRYGAVWALRGGYGLTRILTRLLDRLDADPPVPKPVIGFSDLTPLLDQLGRRGWPVIHGPVVHSLSNTDAPHLDRLFRLLRGQPVPPLAGATWVPGSAEGPVLGGNLAMITATLGTRYALDPTGGILLIEDVGEPSYRIDRLLQHLNDAGFPGRLAGVAVGQFDHCRMPEGADYTVQDVIRGHVQDWGVPVLGDLPIGHGPANAAVHLHAPASIAQGHLHTPAAGPAAST